jgi:hypothetical protein
MRHKSIGQARRIILEFCADDASQGRLWNPDLDERILGYPRRFGLLVEGGDYGVIR